MTPIVLILGGSGRFGRHAAKAFETAGWEVRQFRRGTDTLWDAAWGAHVIVNAWNMPPNRWKQEALKAHESVIEVAQASGATVIVPGNVYNFGADMPALLGAETPHNAKTPYGRIRTQIEAAYRTSGVRTIILRAGDFLDDEPSGNWFDEVMAKTLPKGRLTYPGSLDVPHAWAFLPDMARAAVALAERRDTLPAFADIPYAGLTFTGAELAAAISRAAGREITVKPMSWAAIRLLQPVWPLARYLVSMRYLWRVPHGLDPAPLRALLPDHRDSSAEAALAAAIEHQIRPNGVVPGEADVALGRGHV
ncbi:MAG: epimerase [Pseudomonadota bacterium]